MALQGSGLISLADIQAEFGGSNPVGLSEYYSADTGVPASGLISLSDFYGTSSGPPLHEVTVGSGNGADYPLGFCKAHEWETSSPMSNIGAISPATYNGVSIDFCWVTALKTAYYFYIGLAGNRQKNYFSSVTFDGKTYYTPTAVHAYYSPTGNTRWKWTLSGPPSAAYRTVGSTYNVTFT